MSFAVEFVSLLEKYTNDVEKIKQLKITEFNSKSVIQKYEPSKYIRDFLRDLDYNEEEYLNFENTETKEDFVAEDASYNFYYVDFGWRKDVNKALEQFIIHCFRDSYNEKELPTKTILNYMCIDNLAFALFYKQITGYLYIEIDEEYNLLKEKYPEEKFYPEIMLNTKELDYYESSKCW